MLAQRPSQSNKRVILMADYVRITDSPLRHLAGPDRSTGCGIRNEGLIVIRPTKKELPICFACRHLYTYTQEEEPKRKRVTRDDRSMQLFDQSSV
jgi:hypothetical protein